METTKSRSRIRTLLSSLRAQIQKLEGSNTDLKRRLGELQAQNRLLLQLNEALGDYNRHHASEKLRRPATDNEAFEHYIGNGGKKHFDETHPPKG